VREAHTITKRRIAQAIGAIAILVISCDVSTMLPAGAAFPSPAPGVLETIVAGTAGAAQTQTAILIPATPTLTFTPTVTRTSTVTPTFLTLSGDAVGNTAGRQLRRGDRWRPECKLIARRRTHGVQAEHGF
jgi:hypothetical protein